MNSIADLYAALEAHDWFHEMSDDHGVWERGQADWRRICKMADQSGPMARRLQADYSHHISTTMPWNKNHALKPKLDDYL